MPERAVPAQSRCHCGGSRVNVVLGSVIPCGCATARPARSLPRPPEPDTTIAGRIRARRRELGLTQRFVAQTLGRTQPLIAHWEAGRHAPTIADLAALATLLRVTTDSLIYGEEARDAA